MLSLIGLEVSFSGEGSASTDRGGLISPRGGESRIKRQTESERLQAYGSTDSESRRQ